MNIPLEYKFNMIASIRSLEFPRKMPQVFFWLTFEWEASNAIRPIDEIHFNYTFLNIVNEH